MTVTYLYNVRKKVEIQYYPSATKYGKESNEILIYFQSIDMYLFSKFEQSCNNKEKKSLSSKAVFSFARSSLLC